MTFLEAMKALLDGGKIRQVGWFSGTYIYVVEGKIRHRTGGVFNEPFYPHSKWEMYEERREKKDYRY